MKILLVDDHVILRKALIKILQDKYTNGKITEASNGKEALSFLSKEDFDIALLDITMPEINGIEVLKQVKSLLIKTPILILSMLPENQYAIRVLRAGASGFLSKNCAPKELFFAIDKVLRGQNYISENVANILASTTTDKVVKNQYDLLSDRELEVLKSLAKGKSVSEIANEIGINVNTVSTYRSRILLKLNLTNNVSLIRYAIENKLV